MKLQLKARQIFRIGASSMCLVNFGITISVTVFITLFNFSCKKYLDEKSNSSFVVPSTIQDLQALLDFPENMNFGTPMFAETSVDDYFLEDFNYDAFAGTNDGYAYTWENFDYNFPNDWSSGYRPVYYANLCLETLDKINKTPQNESEWNNTKGMSLFIRSYNFLQLAWTFAKAFDESSADQELGIVLRMGSDFNVPSVRSTLRQTYEQIVNDAKAAILYLPETPVHVMRPSKPAAYGLLARAYLSMRNYDSSFKYANLAMVSHHDLLDFNDPSQVDVYGYAPFSQFHKEVIYYTQVNDVFLFVASNYIGMVDTMLYNSYNDHDLRKEAFFTVGGAYYTFKDYNSGYNMYSGISTNELYMIRAECYARKGNKDAALADLNSLLAKRWDVNYFTPVTAATSSDALSIILQERRKELLRRGLRWIDIKRLNKEGASIKPTRIVHGQTITLEPNSSKYALPIPKDIINQTGIQQN